MQIVSFPPSLIDTYLADARELLQSGQVAEGKYFRDLPEAFVPGRLSVPVTSGGAGIYVLLAYQKYVHGKSVAIVQSNTMRALYTVPRLLDLQVQVADSSYQDFLAMNPDSLSSLLEDPAIRKDAVVVYSVIGGYLAPSFSKIVEVCRNAGVPLIVDGAHAHYLDQVAQEADADIAYSFYATKILPSGEGGLISTSKREIYDWMRRFLIYDRFDNQLEFGLNLRPSELVSALIHRLMTDPALASYFRDNRVEVARDYERVCQQHGIRYLVPTNAADYNGYKFVVLDPLDEVKRLGTLLTEHSPTSNVFDTDVLGKPTKLPHWCPPTYPCLKV